MRTTNEHASIDDIKQDLATLRADMQHLVRDLARDGRHAATDRIHAVEERASELARAARDTANESHEKLGNALKERPITSLAIAVGIGAIAARLMR